MAIELLLTAGPVKTVRSETGFYEEYSFTSKDPRASLIIVLTNEEGYSSIVPGLEYVVTIDENGTPPVVPEP